MPMALLRAVLIIAYLPCARVEPPECAAVDLADPSVPNLLTISKHATKETLSAQDALNLEQIPATIPLVAVLFSAAVIMAVGCWQTFTEELDDGQQECQSSSIMPEQVAATQRNTAADQAAPALLVVTFFTNLYVTMVYTSVIPTSYDAAHAIGGGAAFSGLLISVEVVGCTVGRFAAWALTGCVDYNYRIAISACMFGAAGACALYTICDAPVFASNPLHWVAAY
eukprot:NODE_3286_length_2060_cov_2.985515.p3 GENE.NODE_3286_length_2060_cov_2.985515~~NODE_3286_length_2060_cov_2.985515.p3  ORF type:complete len:226 (+),score=50.15 NODE_3286_length_2060_cov_2.985515:174-851(+)